MAPRSRGCRGGPTTGRTDTSAIVDLDIARSGRRTTLDLRERQRLPGTVRLSVASAGGCDARSGCPQCSGPASSPGAAARTRTVTRFGAEVASSGGRHAADIISTRGARKNVEYDRTGKAASTCGRRHSRHRRECAKPPLATPTAGILPALTFGRPGDYRRRRTVIRYVRGRCRRRTPRPGATGVGGGVRPGSPLSTGQLCHRGRRGPTAGAFRITGALRASPAGRSHRASDAHAASSPASSSPTGSPVRGTTPGAGPDSASISASSAATAARSTRSSNGSMSKPEPLGRRSPMIVASTADRGVRGVRAYDSSRNQQCGADRRIFSRSYTQNG